MGKGKREKKTGKGRLDKYYRLAKEQGYRARSAFKLIQLDKKYDILKGARCVIDLCAAPGGWLQVATKYMPPNSIILGVDLVPIKPIPRVITFAEDITSEKCRRRIREEIRDWKADVVLHDGAPNVGTAWAQDAFTQSELVLSSLRLATEFLAAGGTFVTKVFRSKDYNSLLWVFNQLFGKVEATKPPSSRNVSAEIFVVCTGYRAPKRIDPKLLNPTHVFKDLDIIDSTVSGENPNKDAGSLSMDKLTPAAFNVFHPDKKRRAREGYDEGDLILFKRIPILDFLKSHDPISILGKANQLDFDVSQDGKDLLQDEATTGDIISSCADLRVLGKKDFKMLLRWRSAMREKLGLDARSKEAEEYTETAEVQPLDEEEQMAVDIERLEEEESHRKRRERRRVNERRTRDIQRMQLHMTTPMDVGLETAQQGIGGDDGDEEFMFDLAEVEGRTGKRNAMRTRSLENRADDDENETDHSSEEEDDQSRVSSDGESEDDQRYKDLEANLDILYDEYQNTKLAKDAKHRAKEARKKRDAEAGELLNGGWSGIQQSDSRIQSPEDVDEDGDGTDGDEADTIAYLDRDGETIPSDEIDSSDEDEENRPPAGSSGNRKRAQNENLIKNLKKPKVPLEASGKSRAAAMWFDQAVFKGLEGMDEIMRFDTNVPLEKGPGNEQQKARIESAIFEDEPVLAPKKRKGKHVQTNPDTWDEEEEAVTSKEKENAQRIADFGLTTPEAMTIAQQLVDREKTKTQLIDDGFNRFAFNDKDGLPTWFLDDEMKHFRNNIPVTKEAVEAIRVKMRALNARPIKKVAEAKARKKMKAVKRLAGAQRKADVINETGDLTEQEKSAQINRLVNRATKEPKKKKDEIKFVVAKGSSKGIKGRPKGVKGRFKMVDSRGKKEVRALKRIERRDAGRKRKR